MGAKRKAETLKAEEDKRVEKLSRRGVERTAGSGERGAGSSEVGAEN
jgi:hypothetical protein